MGLCREDNATYKPVEPINTCRINYITYSIRANSHKSKGRCGTDDEVEGQGQSADRAQSHAWIELCVNVEVRRS